MNQKRFPIQSINQERPLFFLHIPKTAGTTIRNTLDSCFPAEKIFPHYYFDQLPKEVDDAELQQYSFFRGHFSLSVMQERVHKPMMMITFLRHPVDQVISSFQQWNRAGLVEAQRINNPDFTDECKRIAKASLEEFLMSDYKEYPRIKNSITNQQTFLLGMNVRHNYTHEGRLRNRGLFDSAKRNLGQFLVVGTIEEMEKSLMLLSYRLVMPKFDSSRRLNTTTKEEKINKNTLPESTRKKIREYVSMDLELYDYARNRLHSDFQEMLTELGEEADLDFNDLAVRDRLHEKIQQSNEAFQK